MLGCPECGSLNTDVHKPGCTWEAHHPETPWRITKQKAIKVDALEKVIRPPEGLADGS